MVGKTSVTRRAFLIGSAAIAGGVAFGVYKLQQPHDNPLLDGLKDGETALTPYIHITGDKITLIGPHADVGQGVQSLQAMLIAEELDIEFGQFDTSNGQPSAAYYNTAIASELVPFKPYENGFQADTMRGVMGGVTKILGLQITGGSSTAPDSFEKLRKAGASARETLKLAASKKTGHSVAVLKTAKGAVILPDGQEIAYTELAADVADITPVQDVSLRPPSEWRMIGKPTQRLDILAKSTGTQAYGIDVEMDDMLHATVKLNPRQGGSLVSMDASAAKAMRGVKDILAVDGGFAVLADNTWRAFQAAEAVDATWSDAAYPSEMDGHWAILSDSFTEEHQDNRLRDDGAVDEVLANAPTLTAEYRAPYLAHAPLEPLSATIKLSDNLVEIWTATQVPRFMQQHVAEITGKEVDQVVIHNMLAGGSFGHRLEHEHVKKAAEVAVKFPNVPIKLTLSREEDMIHDFPRQIAMARMSGKVSNGRIEAYDLSIAMPSVVASQGARAGLPAAGPDLQIVAGAWEQPFAIPNYRVTGYNAKGLAPVSSWRSVGASSNGFFHDAFLDELLTEAGQDPLVGRIQLANHTESRKVLEKLGEIANWQGIDSGNGRFRGVGFCMSFGVPCAQVVEISNGEDGIKLEHVYVVTETGTVLDPINFDNHVKGATIWGLSHAIHAEITYSDGMAEQDNYDSFPHMRIGETPDFTIHGLDNARQLRGIGEPPVPPTAPALANAIFAATGERLREMPFSKFVEFA